MLKKPRGYRFFLSFSFKPNAQTFLYAISIYFALLSRIKKKFIKNFSIFSNFSNFFEKNSQRFVFSKELTF